MNGKLEINGQSPRSEVIQTCSVPLMKCRWPDASDFNDCLSEVILTRAKCESGVTISNVGGWHSDKNLRDSGEDCIRHLVDHMRQISNLMTEALYPEYLEQFPDGWHLEAWANVNGPGSFNKSHDHTANGNIWSGIYYVKTDTLEAGWIPVQVVSRDWKIGAWYRYPLPLDSGSVITSTPFIQNPGL